MIQQSLAEGKLMISIITEEIHTNYEVIISDSTTIGDILSEIGKQYHLTFASSYISSQ